MNNLSEKEKKREIRENLKIYLKIVVFNGYFYVFWEHKILLLIFAIKKHKIKGRGKYAKISMRYQLAF